MDNKEEHKIDYKCYAIGELSKISYLLTLFKSLEHSEVMNGIRRILDNTDIREKNPEISAAISQLMLLSSDVTIAIDALRLESWKLRDKINESEEKYD